MAVYLDKQLEYTYFTVKFTRHQISIWISATYLILDSNLDCDLDPDSCMSGCGFNPRITGLHVNRICILLLIWKGPFLRKANYFVIINIIALANAVQSSILYRQLFKTSEMPWQG